MRIRGRIVGLALAGMMVPVVGCGGGGGGRATMWAADTAEAVRVLRTPANPYGIIYHSAVDLTKRPDTTKVTRPRG